MTDEIRDRFEQMFAPRPIPQCVLDAYKRTVFLLNKIDAPQLYVRDLCIIAGCALANSGQAYMPATEGRPEVDMGAPMSIDGPQSPAAPPVGGRMDAPPVSTEKTRATTMQQLATLDEGELKAHAQLLGLSIPDGLDRMGMVNFIMGNPYQRPARTNKPATAQLTPKKKKGLSENKMRKMKLPDLRKHAEDVYGYKPTKRYGKDTLAAVLQGMTPLD